MLPTARILGGCCTVLLALGVVAYAPAPVRAAGGPTGTITLTGNPDLLIYNNDMALVRQPAKLHLPKGQSRVTLVGVPQRLDSTSVRLEGKDFTALRQWFEYDLWNTEKVFRRFLGDTIAYRYAGRAYRGLLAGIDGDQLFIERRDSADVLTMMRQSQLTDVEFPARMGLSTRPLLIWEIGTGKSGDQSGLLSYLTAGIRWSAEYTAVLDKDEKSVELTGWATIVNRSGTSFDGAAVSLVAGEVHRAGEAIDRGTNEEETPAAPGAPKPSELFAYYLYTIPGSLDVDDMGTVQASIVTPTKVPASRSYRYDGARDGSKVRVQVDFGNEQNAGLGIPLPAGRVRVYKPDPTGILALVGEDEIDHTPPGERVKILSGVSFDLVGDRTRVAHTRVSRNVTEDQMQIKIRNAGRANATVTVVEALYGNWEITAKSTDFKKQSADEVQFDLPVPAGKEATLAYTVRYTF